MRAENERLRLEKRAICDKFKALCEEKEQILHKLSQTKTMLKHKDQMLHEFQGQMGELQY